MEKEFLDTIPLNQTEMTPPPPNKNLPFSSAAKPNSNLGLKGLFSEVKIWRKVADANTPLVLFLYLLILKLASTMSYQHAI